MGILASISSADATIFSHLLPGRSTSTTKIEFVPANVTKTVMRSRHKSAEISLGFQESMRDVTDFPVLNNRIQTQQKIVTPTIVSNIDRTSDIGREIEEMNRRMSTQLQPEYDIPLPDIHICHPAVQIPGESLSLRKIREAEEDKIAIRVKENHRILQSADDCVSDCHK